MAALSLRALVTLLAVAACKDRPPAPTYRDVAPILARHCASCHALVPPRLATYAQAAPRAAQISITAQRREMPPWGPDVSGSCGDFAGAPSLSSDEIATLVAWAERGAPDGAAAPAPPPAESLTGRRLTLEAGTVRVGLGGDARSCTVVDPGLGEDAFVTGVAVQGAVAQAMVWEAASCDGDGRLVASWSWNTPVQRFPAGTGIRLTAGKSLVVKLRYNLLAAGVGTPVSARVELSLGEGVREARLVPLGELPADRPLRLRGLVPRVRRGRTLRLDRGSECLTYFGHWQPDDEQLFSYARPVDLAPGERVALSCEECVAYLYVEGD